MCELEGRAICLLGARAGRELRAMLGGLSAVCGAGYGGGEWCGAWPWRAASACTVLPRSEWPFPPCPVAPPPIPRPSHPSPALLAPHHTLPLHGPHTLTPTPAHTHTLAIPYLPMPYRRRTSSTTTPRSTRRTGTCARGSSPLWAARASRGPQCCSRTWPAPWTGEGWAFSLKRRQKREGGSQKTHA